MAGDSMFDLTGKVVLMTGATGHLGNAMVSAIAEAGASVVVSSRELDRADEVASKLDVSKGQVHSAIEMDHLDERSISQGFQNAVRLGRKIDVLINNGHAGLGSDWKTVTAEQFQHQLNNLTGYFLLSRLFRDHIVERQAQGNLIFLGSMYAQVASYPDVYEGIGPANPVAYQSLKAGILQMARHLAAYWAKDGIRVNCLSPGPFPSPQAPKELVDRIASKSPMNRIGLPDELKGPIVFLASDASSYMTGHNLVIDGGWTSW